MDSSPYLDYFIERKLKPVVKAIERDTGKPARTTAIAARLGVPRRTVQRYAAMAEAAGELIREGFKRGYSVPAFVPNAKWTPMTNQLPLPWAA